MEPDWVRCVPSVVNWFPAGPGCLSLTAGVLFRLGRIMLLIAGSGAL